ncbi:hypothetical protein [Nonomuraea sp. NPDC001831]|uniref:hypothetical protein n=1 Tax=Nonomuraea sp. NPDC001831 TaxID=3364340 RepID=UPI0036BDACC7
MGKSKKNSKADKPKREKTVTSRNGTIFVAQGSITTPNGVKITAKAGGVVRYCDGDLDVHY